MGLVYEDERYFSACDVKKFDAEKFDRFVDNLAHDIDRYIGDARALENGYGKYYNNSTYVGKAATASKEFIDRKQFEKFHVGSKDIQRELFNRCLGVKNMFEARVDPSPKARIDNETLDLIKRDHMTFADKLEYEGYDIECIAREIESEYGKYGDVTQPNYRRALVVYDEFCGSGGFLDKCLRKFEGFNEEARQYTKRSMIKEQSNELQKDIKTTASALEGMTVFKTEVQRQAVWLNAFSTNQAVVDPKKLAADIKECFELTGIKYDKNAIVDANILKNATDLALLNCKSNNEKVALLACTEAVQEIVRDPMTLEAFLKALWETLALIGTTLVTIVSMAASTVGGIIAELNPVVLVVTLVIVLISGITYFASKSEGNEKEAESQTETDSESKAITAGNGGSNNNDDDNNDDDNDEDTDDEFDLDKLTRSQRKAVESAENTINDHLKESDLEAAKGDLEGNPIPKGNGENWNHEQEVRDAYPALKRAQKTIEGSLKNPNLDSETRGFLQEELSKIIYYIERIEEIFEPYGGLGWTD